MTDKEFINGITQISKEGCESTSEEKFKKIYDLSQDWMRETKNYDIESCFDDYYNYETVEERTKNELERGGLERLYYFLQPVDNLNAEYFRVNAYGNLSNIDDYDIYYLVEDITSKI